MSTEITDSVSATLVEPLPPTRNQQMMWLDLQAHPEKASYYNIVFKVEIAGTIDRVCFERALQETINSTTACHLRFRAAPTGELEQSVLDCPGTELIFHDFSETENSAKKANDWIEERRLQHIDLVNESPYRFALLKIGEHEFIWFGHFHHLIMDGVGQVTFRKRVAQTYTSLYRSGHVQLQTDSDVYVSYLRNENAYNTSDQRAEDREFWQQNLRKDAGISLSVKTTRASMISEPKKIFAPLGTEVGARLKDKAAEIGVSFPHFIAAACVLYVQRLTQASYLTFGMPIHGRFEESHRGLMGSFTNIIPVMFEAEADTSISTFFVNAANRLKDALAHGRLPYEDIRQALAVNPNAPPLYNLSINVLPNHRDLHQFGDSVGDPYIFPRYEHDLIFWAFFSRGSDDVEVGLYGNVHRYAAWEIDLHVKRLSHFLTKLGDCDVSTLLGDISPISEDEHTALTKSFIPPYDPPQQWDFLSQRFEAQVAKTPDAIAVVCGDQHLTYSELNQRANQVGRYLREQGVGPDKFVGLCFYRSLDMIVALWGVVKAGGVYVPLDPSYPQERVAMMIEEVQPTVLLTQESVRPQLPTTTEKFLTVSLDSERCVFEDFDATNLNPVIIDLSPDNLIYVIFTSGSTGKPKATCVYQRGVLNLVDWYVKEFQFNQQDKGLIVSSFSFDLTQKNLFAFLLKGGELHLAPEPFDPFQIAVNISNANITTINLAPSAFYAIVEADDNYTALSSLKRVVLGGEPIEASKIASIAKVYPHVEIVNSYGPTECSDVTSFFRIKDTELNNVDMIPSGFPVPNTATYIVNNNQTLAPIGTAGEICIGGIGVGQGYLNRYELTKERFIRDPYQGTPTLRLYKTGDQGRWFPNGCLEYLGRNDDQVKLRGYRVELSEIATQLEMHERVKKSVVVVREEAANNQRLIAYIETANGLHISAADLNVYLRHVLPSYMVPNAYVFVDAFPLSPNGKLDKSKLPEPAEPIPSTGKDIESPIAIDLCKIWSELLGIKPEMIDSESNFFDLGGHSLLAYIMKTKIEKSFKLSVPVPLLHGCKNLAELESVILRENSIEYLKGQYNQDRKVKEILSSDGSNKDSKVLENLDEYLLEKINRYNVPGVSTTIFYRNKIYHGSAGVSQVGASKKVGLDTLFRIGCTMKLLVSMLAMRLVDQNIVELDKPIKAYWPEFKVKDNFATNSISLRHLLTHSSGLDEYKTLAALKYTIRNKEEFASLLAGIPQLCSPGEQSVYCCINFSIIGVFVERIHGAPLNEIISDDMLKPLGIKEFYFPPYLYLGDQVAEGYTNDGHVPYNPDKKETEYNDWVPSMGFGVMTSTKELVKLVIPLALNENNDAPSFLSREAIDLILQEQMRVFGDPGCRGIGLGWYHFLSGGIGHRGNGIGHQSFLQVVPSKQLAIAFMGNKYPCEQVFAELLFDIVGYDNASADRNGSRIKEYSDCIGVYKNSACSVAISIESKNLVYSISSNAGKAVGMLEEMPGTNYFRLEKKDEDFGVLSFIVPEGSSLPRYVTLWDVFYRRV